LHSKPEILLSGAKVLKAVRGSRFMSANEEFFAVLCPRGAAHHLQTELAELHVQATLQGPEWVQAPFSSESVEAVIRHSQLATRILMLHGRASSRDELVALASTVRPQGSFAVRATGSDKQELQELVGGAIKHASDAPVNLAKPDETYLIIDLDGEYLFGKALAGELGKRHYKIITGAYSLAGPVAAAIVRESGWKPTEALVTWPCTTGELPIEAALWATKKSPRAYELRFHEKQDAPAPIVAADPKLAMVATAQKNAKVAGIHAAIRFSRQDLDWLDTKHDERGVGYFVGLLPNLKLFPKFIKELFYQLDFILENGGVACFACVNDESADLLEAGIALATRTYTSERTYVWSGQSAFTLVRLVAKGARKTKKTAA
jgi:23S rRNA G2445 N2-methylase RlmL